MKRTHIRIFGQNQSNVGRVVFSINFSNLYVVFPISGFNINNLIQTKSNFI